MGLPPSGGGGGGGHGSGTGLPTRGGSHALYLCGGSYRLAAIHVDYDIFVFCMALGQINLSFFFWVNSISQFSSML